MSTARTALLCAFAFGAGVLAHQARAPVAPLDVHLSGDGSTQIAAALFTWPGPARAADPAGAALEVVTFRRWQNVETMTDLMSVCGSPCDGGTPVVLLRRPSFDGMAKVLFIDLGAFGAGPALDRGEPIDATTLACVTALIDRHLSDRAPTASPCPEVPETEALRPRLRVPRDL